LEDRRAITQIYQNKKESLQLWKQVLQAAGISHFVHDAEDLVPSFTSLQPFNTSTRQQHHRRLQLWNQVLQAAGYHRQPKLKNPFKLLSLLLQSPAALFATVQANSYDCIPMTVFAFI